MANYSESKYEHLRNVVVTTIGNYRPGTDVLKGMRFAHLAIRAYDENAANPMENFRNIWRVISLEDELKQARLQRLVLCQEVAIAIERAIADLDDEADVIPDPEDYSMLVQSIGELIDSLQLSKELPADEFIRRLRASGDQAAVLVNANKMANVIETLQNLGLVEN